MLTRIKSFIPSIICTVIVFIFAGLGGIAFVDDRIKFSVICLIGTLGFALLGIGVFPASKQQLSILRKKCSPSVYQIFFSAIGVTLVAWLFWSNNIFIGGFLIVVAVALGFWALYRWFVPDKGKTT